MTKADIEYQITVLTEMHSDFIDFNDTVSFTGDYQLEYVTADIILANVQKSSYTAIQELEQQKRDSLIEYEFITASETTLFNICFEIYGVINDDKWESLIEANDLYGLNRTDIDPNSPTIPKNTKIIYYK